MKQMISNAKWLLVFLPLFLLITNVTVAQQANTTGPGTFQTAKDINYPAGSNDPSLIKKTESGAALNTATGDVTVFTTNEEGQTVQTVYSKPVADIQIGFAESFEKFSEQFEYWMKFNPDFKNYLTAEQNTMFESNQIEAMFKQMYFSSLNSQPVKKVSNN